MDLGKVVNLQLGPQAGIFLNGKLTDTQGHKSSLNNFYKSELAIVGGIGFNIGKHFNIGACVNYGLTSISKSSYDVKSRVANIFIGFTF